MDNQMKPTSVYEAQQSFGTFLKDAIQDVNKKQIRIRYDDTKT